MVPWAVHFRTPDRTAAGSTTDKQSSDKTQEFGLQQEYKKKGIVYLIVKQLVAFALLPENEIFQGFSVYFEFLMNYYSICFNIVSIILIYIDTFLQDIKRKYADELSNQPQVVQDDVKLLYAYYMNYWLREVEPVTFSVYRDNNRTNNAIECWNRLFNERVLVAHPGFFKFTSKKIFLINRLRKGTNFFVKLF